MKFASILLAASLAVSSSAYAGVLGSSVTSQYYFNGGAYLGSPDSPATFVADGAAHANFEGVFDITVSDTQIIYTFLQDIASSPSNVSLNTNGLFIIGGNLLTFAGAPALTNVSWDALSFTDPLMSYSFNSTQVAVNWNDVSFTAGDKVILNLTTAPVPEPENMAMLLAGLGLIAVMRRRYS